MTDEKIALRDVVVLREGRNVLDIPALRVERGEVLALLGPNGSGKSTLLSVIALLLKPDKGTVLFDGQPAGGAALAYRRRMAVVFQEPLLLNTTVEANVRSGLSLRAIKRSAQGERVGRWLGRLGIAHLTRRPARELSGGEAQRTNLARALAMEPEVLLLDEPFGGLDAPTKSALIGDLNAILRETSTTTIFVTHDRDEALRLSDRVAVIINGCIRQAGPPQEVFSSPVDAETAAFLGVETIALGRLVSCQDGLAIIEVAGRRIEAVETGPLTPEVLVCLRPENVLIQPAAGSHGVSSARNHLAGTVQKLERLGAQVRLDIDCGFPLTALVTTQSADDLDLRIGGAVIASFKASAVHLIPRGASDPPRANPKTPDEISATLGRYW